MARQRQWGFNRFKFVPMLSTATLTGGTYRMFPIKLYQITSDAAFPVNLDNGQFLMKGITCFTTKNLDTLCISSESEESEGMALTLKVKLSPDTVAFGGLDHLGSTDRYAATKEFTITLLYNPAKDTCQVTSSTIPPFNTKSM
jgi:hypothetical protein